MDQYGVFLVGALLGMTLPAVLAVQCLPQGKELRGLAVAAEIAQGLSRMSGHSLWILTLLCGFWILYSSQLGNMDILILDCCDLEALGAACEKRKRPEFLLTIAPLAVPNGTGSPVNPIATF